MRDDPEDGQFGFGRYGVTELPAIFIPLSDGVRLSARIWIPSDQLIPPFSSLSHHPRTTIKRDDRGEGSRMTESDQTGYGGRGEQTGSEGVCERFPAILEYLPYYKDVHTAARDHARHPWFTSHG